MSGSRVENRSKSSKSRGNADRSSKSATTALPVVTPSAFLAELRASLGLVSLACQKTGATFEQYESWLATEPGFAREVELIEEFALDFVECKAYEEIRKGNARLIQFFLETKGKKRGYDVRAENDKAPVVALLSAEEMEY